MAGEFNNPFSQPISLWGGAVNKQTVDPSFSLNNNQKITANLKTGTGSSTPKSGSFFSTGQYFQQKYNELTYNVELYLDNSGSFDGQATNRFPINPSAVLNLSITDTVNDWVVDGSLAFMYLPDDLELDEINKTGQKQKTLIKGASDNGDVVKSYQFRSDGFDLLRVMISPITKNTTGDPDAIVINENDPKWYLSYLFSVYEVEDVSSVPKLKGNLAAYMKCLKLYFRDVRYQILKTTNLEYSTANSPYATYDPSFASVDANKQTGGVTQTGVAMLEVLNQAIGTVAGVGSLELMQLNGPNWDPGISSLFYTSPANCTALEDLDYLYSHHVSTKKLQGVDANDFALLHTTRANEPTYIEPLCLTPVSDFFEKATDGDNPGELQLEHFFVTTQTNEKATLNDFRAPMGGDGKSVDLKTFKYGQIISYSFVDMSADINSSVFTSTPVYSVDIQNRVFNVKFKGNDVLSARKAIAENYISKLYKKSSSNEKLFLPTIHKTKQNVNVFPTFSLNGDNETVRQKKGILDLMYTGLFQNACICFKTFGLTLRESGSFIGIDKTNGCSDSDYNNKLFGQYFVVKVDHIFEAGTYMNVIYAIKIHRYKDQETQFGDTL